MKLKLFLILNLFYQATHATRYEKQVGQYCSPLQLCITICEKDIQSWDWGKDGKTHK
jgi:hypothetical protein